MRIVAAQRPQLLACPVSGARCELREALEVSGHDRVVMVAPDAALAAALDEVDDLGRTRTVADDVAGADDRAHLAILEMRHHRSQRFEVGMHVRDDGDVQLDPPVPGTNEP
jgi:hypothetical protein